MTKPILITCISTIKKTVVFILFMNFYCMHCVNGQVPWPITFVHPLNDSPMNAIVDTSHARYVYFGSREDAFIGIGSSVGLVCSIGFDNDTLSKTYRLNSPDSSCTFGQVIKDEQDGFYVFGNAYGAPDYYGHASILFAHIDFDLNLTRYKIITPNWHSAYYSFSYKVLPCAEGFIIGGIYNNYPNNISQVFLMKLDKQGSVLKAVDFPDQTEPSSTFQDLMYGRDSTTIWMTGYGYDGQGLVGRTVFDTAFNIIDARRLPDPPQSSPHLTLGVKLDWISDTTLLMMGNYTFFESGHPQNNDIGFSEIDTSLAYTPVTYYGAIDTMDIPAYRNPFAFRDRDSIYFAGLHNQVVGFWPHGKSWLMIGQLDSQFNARYIRYYGGDAYYDVFGLELTQDGGIIVQTRKYDWPLMNSQWDAVFWKFDEQGILTGMPEQDALNGQGQLALVYPNPGVNILHIECGAPRGSLMMMDMLGQTHIIQPLTQGSNAVNTGFLKKGTYLYRIQFSNNELLNGTWIKN